MTNMAVVFPGQGSQSVGMLSALAAAFPVVSETFSTASALLQYDLWALVQLGPLETLNQTEFTQVAMLVSDVAVYRVLQSQGLPLPQMMAGHSLGEYAALVCAEILSLEAAVLLVQQRGRLMQAHVPTGVGAMAAVVGLEDAVVETLCQQVSTSTEWVSPANYNAIGQVVVAGHVGAIDRVLIETEKAGARLSTRIPVSVPCHCELLREASQHFAVSLQSAAFQMPKCAVVSNVDAQPYLSAAAIPVALEKQLFSPVRWVQTIQYMATQGIDTIIECGPGAVLSGLIKRIDRTIQVYSVQDELGLEKVRTVWML